MIVVGTRLCGRVDEVPGFLYLVTEFFHLNFVPLIPLRSFLVYHGTQRRGPMRLSAKSIFFAYLRVALVVGVVFSAVPAFFMLADGLNRRPEHLLVCLGLFASAASCGVLFGVSYRLARAKPLRALYLATQAGIAPEVLARYYADKLSQKELDELVQHAHSAQEMSALAQPDG